MLTRSSKDRFKLIKDDYVICSVCGKRVRNRICAPRGYKIKFPFQHKNVATSDWCRGSNLSASAAPVKGFAHEV